MQSKLIECIQQYYYDCYRKVKETNSQVECSKGKVTSKYGDKQPANPSTSGLQSLEDFKKVHVQFNVLSGVVTFSLWLAINPSLYSPFFFSALAS